METTPHQNVTFPSAGGRAHGYLALPAAGRGPGVLVIQEWWGLTDHIRDVADRLAADPSWAAGTAQEAGAEAAGADELARMVVLLAGVPLRFALSSPAHAAEAGLTAEALEASLALFRHVRRVLP